MAIPGSASDATVTVLARSLVIISLAVMSAVFTEYHHSSRSLILAIAEAREAGLQKFHPELTESTVLCLSNF
jgi:hypothetical protein